MEELMSVLEGVCPHCGSDLKLVRIAGIRRWLQENTFQTRDVEVHEWARSADNDIGCLTYKCEVCNRQFEAYANRFGDWAM